MSTYSFPWDLFLALARDLPSGERSLLSDSRHMVSRMSPAPEVYGLHNVPPQGPVVLAANHYQRRGLWIAWPGAVITVNIGTVRGGSYPVHWLVTGGLRAFQAAGRGPEVPLSRRIFRSVARAYQMSALPVSGNRARAAALRAWLRWAEQGKVIGMFPEGLAGNSMGLRPPAEEFARIFRLVCRRAWPVLPVGIHEQGEVLQVRFGAPIGQPEAEGGPEIIMQAIASLLPEALRGPYSGVPAKF